MNPTINQILQAFFADRLYGSSGAKRRRTVLVEQVLRACLEESGDRVLTTGELELLDLERSFEPRDVLVRTMHADALIFVLPLFVSEPYLLPDRLDVLEQVRVAAGLQHMVVSSGLIDARDFSCPILDLEYAIRMARSRTTTREP